MAKPRFLRRHYPHQVQGVRSTFLVDHLSQAAPPHQFLGQIKTDKREVNKVDRPLRRTMPNIGSLLRESNIEQGTARSTS